MRKISIFYPTSILQSRHFFNNIYFTIYGRHVRTDTHTHSIHCFHQLFIDIFIAEVDDNFADNPLLISEMAAGRRKFIPRYIIRVKYFLFLSLWTNIIRVYHSACPCEPSNYLLSYTLVT